MFEKQIDRDIKGVIKVGQSDEENVYQELDEYVVTYFNNTFDVTINLLFKHIFNLHC